MRYEYKTISPSPRPSATSPVMSGDDIAEWLNEMDSDGWELISHAQKHWLGMEPFVQSWWIFRRPRD